MERLISFIETANCNSTVTQLRNCKVVYDCEKHYKSAQAIATLLYCRTILHRDQKILEIAETSATSFGRIFFVKNGINFAYL